MISRLLTPPQEQNYFLFGARGTGKTTFLENWYHLVPEPSPSILYINLLDPDQEDLYLRHPNQLKEILSDKSHLLKTVIIDEVQKAPRILDVVHYCIEKYKNIQFVMTGSSARKLKHGGANLLGGRAFSFYMHPITSFEDPQNKDLSELLSWGSLPKLYELESELEKQRYLKSYVQTYLKQEIQLEQLVRDMLSFREFLDLAAQSSGEIINYANIAARSKIDEKTVARFFEILVDTLVGHFLEPYDESIRERQSQKPKFYLFDTGIQRQIVQQSKVKVVVGSSEYGRLFEQMIICECIRLNDYFESDYRFYFLRTKDGAEIDLIVKKPKKKIILIEIKSSSSIIKDDYRHLIQLGKSIKQAEKWVLCTEKQARKTDDGIRILPWKQGLKELFSRSKNQ